uniref:Uncharacterized protein n=1 Tax=Eutreptiella gymnastica TaxID=73025 RepID=A0A7S4FPF6_9EUGL
MRGRKPEAEDEILNTLRISPKQLCEQTLHQKQAYFLATYFVPEKMTVLANRDDMDSAHNATQIAGCWVVSCCMSNGAYGLLLQS